ncbi:hypothetical protein DL96DRAFT_1275874 [Flagelloscypha sp. PMI_526]|nr:hypothetical protein DL96DRAFT_1275874 [Flagelloscypha sp. PMI_526]
MLAVSNSDIEGGISHDASPSTSASAHAAPAQAAHPPWLYSNGSQPTQRCQPPSPSPAPAPQSRDPDPELELATEPVDDIEAGLPERKRRRNEILAKYSSHQGTPQLRIRSIPIEHPSTKASTLVGDEDGDTAAAEGFHVQNRNSETQYRWIWCYWLHRIG